MESTLLTSLLNAFKLKRWLADPSCPAVVAQCKAEFDWIYGSEQVDDAEDMSDVEGRWDDEDESPTTQMPPVDLWPLLQSPLACVSTHAWFHLHSVIYSRYTTHPGNSQVFFYPGDNQSRKAVPGHIKYIYTENGCTFVALQCLHLSTVSLCDPYAQYPHFPAMLYSSLYESLECIHVGSITHHFLMWQSTPDQVVVLCLFRDWQGRLILLKCK